MTGSGTLLDPYVIWDVNDLQNMALDLTAYYELGQDIDASATVGWNWNAVRGVFEGFVPIGPATTVVTTAPSYPSGDHSSAGLWTIFPADGIMWTKVDDPAGAEDDDATYIEATSDGAWALLNVVPPAVPANASRITLNLYAKHKRPGATGRWQHFIRFGGVNYLVGRIYFNTNTNYWTSTTPIDRNPATGRKWTPADIAAIEAIGVYVHEASCRFTALRTTVRYDDAFTGFFNGRDHSITGLHIDRIGMYGVGLISYAHCAEISNVNLINVDVTSDDDYVGALVGRDDNGSIITNCHVSGSVNGDLSCGGLIGDANLESSEVQQGEDGMVIVGCTSDCVVNGRYDVGGLIGEANYCLVRSCSATGQVQATSNTAGGLIGQAYYTNVDGCSATGDVLNGGYQSGGLIGESEYCTIVSCHATGDVAATSYSAGGLIGEGYHDTVTDCYATGDVTSLQYEVGGLIGEMRYGTITRCYATGQVSGNQSQIGGLIGEGEYTIVIDQCFATGYVSSTNAAARRVGGLVGDLEGTIRNSYATGRVEGNNGDRIGGLCGDNDGGTILNSWSRGQVAGGPIEVGGLVGRNNGGTTTDSFWDTETSGQATSAGGTGKTTAEMKTPATFNDAGWDILYHSVHDPTGGYPWLSWQVPGASPIWYIYYITPGPGPPPIPVVATLPATGVR